MLARRPWTAVSVHGVIAAAVFGIALILYSSIQLHHDVAWYAYCNLRQLEGMRPYVDVIEVSPPITFYLTLAPMSLAAKTGMPFKFCIAAHVLTLTAISLALARSFDAGASIAERRWKVVAGAFVLTVVPMAVFAQREHFAALLALPYFYAAGARLRGGPVPVVPAVITGLMAGIGFSIKHYFLLAPLLVESALLILKRSPRTLVRPELVAAVIAGLIYTAFVLLIHPEYLSEALPLVLATYDAYCISPWSLAARPWCIAITFAIIFWLIVRRHTRNVPTADCLFLGAVAFYSVFFWQAKGWAYHALPAKSMLAMSGVELFCAIRFGRAWSMAPSKRLRWLLPASPLALVLAESLATGTYRNQLALDVAPYIERHAPGGSIHVMSSTISSGFPMVLEARARWASRFACKWLLPAVIRSQRPDSRLDAGRKAELARLASWEIDATVADFHKFKPDIVFVDCAYRLEAQLAYGQTIDMVEYYLRDPRFREIWKHYTKTDVLLSGVPGRPQQFDVWIREDPAAH